MPRIKAGDLSLNYVEHGRGDNVVLAVHGNLGCADWLALVLPLLPPDLHVIAPEWRGCGDSDKPEPASDYSNYSMATHAQDMLNLLDALGIEKCHLYGHSTGGIICSYMLVMQPERFRKVLMLDPVTPLGLQLAPGQIDVLAQMKSSYETCFAGMASAAPTLFRPESLTSVPQFADTTSAVQRALFERIIERTTVLSDGIWFGTPSNLAKEWESKALAARMPAMTHEHLLLCGGLDSWVPREHFEEMAARLPNARLEMSPFIGHSMNLEAPAVFAQTFANYFKPD
ncbi:alpha/beta hydrolase [Ramlibacter sp. PS3R-8]|uniref:alpha/beta fold hydrolase n=1 Tax=Ramlibacter sp. PS3R-8 TaxID=3133437 RepID=UPI0030A5B5FF